MDRGQWMNISLSSSKMDFLSDFPSAFSFSCGGFILLVMDQMSLSWNTRESNFIFHDCLRIKLVSGKKSAFIRFYYARWKYIFCFIYFLPLNWYLFSCKSHIKFDFILFFSFYVLGKKASLHVFVCDCSLNVCRQCFSLFFLQPNLLVRLSATFAINVILLLN